MSETYTEAVLRASKLIGGNAALARAIGVKPPTVQQWVNGERKVPPSRCVAIERLTGGDVTRKDLRPTDWAEYWPELAEVAQHEEGI
ncbi:helix-turn-helix domain-containing protein [Paraburkholderia sp. Ac-20340]|uniref:transcriptional regulator n=1 Tax=Paraburkholderia sp. Ac-20340 TaxID=2703888 RepID=UPI00197DFAE5|nr:Cro/CI family transcriptional regulator [Paraburkholderia sp. Ac-20340]MBN3851970.1 helix-turn-helix domain-containing protein [Paraburkholderia sp. Ac-20340]